MPCGVHGGGEGASRATETRLNFDQTCLPKIMNINNNYTTTAAVTAKTENVKFGWDRRRREKGGRGMVEWRGEALKTE